jgi:hypothetical protein
MTALPQASAVLRLGRITKGGDLILCEAMIFNAGRSDIETVLRRAAVCWRVEVGGDIGDHLADVLDAQGDLVETVALDARSYAALKNHWMRCKIDTMLSPRSGGNKSR